MVDRLSDELGDNVIVLNESYNQFSNPEVTEDVPHDGNLVLNIQYPAIYPDKVTILGFSYSDEHLHHISVGAQSELGTTPYISSCYYAPP